MYCTASELISLDTTEEHKDLFRELYETSFYPVAKFISANGGSFEQARDIFQEALIVYYEKTLQQNSNAVLSDKAYVIGIAKHLWNRSVKQQSKLVSLDGFKPEIQLPEHKSEIINENKLLSLIELAGRKCLELLQAFYYEKKTVNDITKLFNYRSEHSATVQKYKCLEKVRDEVKHNSMSYADFTE